MAIIEYDGITFTDVKDLIAYKQSIGQQEEPTRAQPEPKAAERQYKPYVPKQKVVIVQPQARQPIGIEKHHAEIEDFFRKYFRKEKIKAGKLAILAKRLNFAKQTLKTYASQSGIIPKIMAEKAAKKQAKAAILKSRGDPYSKADEQLILSDTPTGVIAEQLGRTQKAIVIRRSILLKKHPTLKKRYMLRNKPVKPLSYDETMISKAREESAPQGSTGAITAFPLTKESIETLRTLLQDSAERKNIITFGVAKSNLSLLDGRDFTFDVWQDITSQILRQSEAIWQQWKVKVYSQGMQGNIRAQ